MSQPTINDVQAVDPVLTNLLIGYGQADERFIASRVFPAVNVDKDSGTYYLVTKKYSFLDGLENRAPGGAFADQGYGVSTDTYKTLQWAAQETIADETRANSQLPMELEQLTVKRLSEMSNIRKERAFAADFMVTSVWDNTDTTATDWDDFASGDPVSNVLTASLTISNSSGKEANTLVIGLIVHNALVNHPDIIDRIKYTQAATMANVNGAVGAALGIENYLVARASYNSADEGQSFTGAAIIDDDALVCHVDPSAGVFGATAGKTFSWQPGGGMGQMFRVRADKVHADLIQIKEQWDQKVTATDLGYLFTGIV